MIKGKGTIQMKVEFIGQTPPPTFGYEVWSNPVYWAGGIVPESSPGLHVQLDAAAGRTSLANLGSAADPFVVNAVVGLGHPSLNVSGFLYAHDLIGLSSVATFVPNGTLVVTHDLKDVGSVRFQPGT